MPYYQVADKQLAAVIFNSYLNWMTTSNVSDIIHKRQSCYILIDTQTSARIPSRSLIIIHFKEEVVYRQPDRNIIIDYVYQKIMYIPIIPSKPFSTRFLDKT